MIREEATKVSKIPKIPQAIFFIHSLGLVFENFTAFDDNALTRLFSFADFIYLIQYSSNKLDIVRDSADNKSPSNHSMQNERDSSSRKLNDKIILHLDVQKCPIDIMSVTFNCVRFFFFIFCYFKFHSKYLKLTTDH